MQEISEKRDDIEESLSTARASGAQFVDIRLESSDGTSISAKDGITKVTTSNELGAGIRAFLEGAWGFAYTTKIDRDGLIDCSERAVSLAKAVHDRAEKFSIEVPTFDDIVETTVLRVPTQVPVAEKLTYVLRQEQDAKETDKRVSSTEIGYSDIVLHKIIANSEGTYVDQTAIRSIARAMIFAKEGALRQSGYKAKGDSRGFELFLDNADIGRTAATQAVSLLDAKPAPPGKFDAILDPSLAGVFAHEAFGHASEADAIISGTSILAGKLQQEIGAAAVTIVDDPSLQSYGYMAYDDEGIRTRRKVLLERGFLQTYLTDIETGSRLGLGSNGSARTQRYDAPPIVRMSNTFFEPGDYTFQELLEGFTGIYFIGWQYGYTTPTTGMLTFKSREAYAVEDGELKDHLRDAALSAMTLEVLHNITAITRTLSFDPGTCGKGGQMTPNTTGGAYTRVSDVIVGGM
ncbi:MAG TPA: TldD/PmbA family protein [Candidatus Bathyarchaeia archaeon]|nr:TldD/PmbA family protein [Candidatus Bathyarchaeia archaeon]